MNRIIYERYYEEDNIVYIGTEDVEDNILNDYLKQGLRDPSRKHYLDKDEDIYFQINQTLFEWCQIFMNQRRYIRSLRPEDINKYLYINENKGEAYLFSQERIMEFKNSKED